MSFTLDTLSGKGSKAVKVSADENTSNSQKTAQVLVQVNGITKQVIQLVQKAKKDPGKPDKPDKPDKPKNEYQAHVQTDVAYVGSGGGEIKVYYWVTYKGEIIPDVPKLKCINKGDGQEGGNTIDSGVDSDNRHWIVDKVPANSGGRIYTATHDSSTAKAEVAQKDIQVYLTTDRHYIPSKGGTAKLTYWAVIDNKITSDNLVLRIKPYSSNLVAYNLTSKTKDSDGKTIEFLNVNPNLINGESFNIYFDVKNTVISSSSKVVDIQLLSQEMKILPNKLDLLYFNCHSKFTSKESPDTATMVIGSKIPVGNTLLDNCFVGSMGDNFSINGIKKYIQYLGNTNTPGTEGSLINLKEIREKGGLINRGITKLYSYIYGNWVTGQRDGIRFNLYAYRGASFEIIDNKVKPTGNTELVYSSDFYPICSAFCSVDYAGITQDDVKKYFSNIAVIEYAVDTDEYVFKPTMIKTGRSVRASIRVKGENVNFLGNGFASINKDIPYSENNGGILKYTWSDGREIVFEGSNNSKNTPIYATEYPVVDTTGSEPWVHVSTLDRDDKRHITGVSLLIDDSPRPDMYREAIVRFKFVPHTVLENYELDIVIHQLAEKTRP